MTAKSTLFTGAITIASALCFLGTPPTADAQECDLTTPGPCTRTSGAALRACRHDVRDGYWIAIGQCRNLTSGRPACTSEARDARAEEFDFCDETCSARQVICDNLGPGRYDPIVDPANFVSPAAAAASPNPYFPLTPGLVRTYAVDDEVIVVTVTDETTIIEGIECTVIRDTVTVDGVVVEDTDDWYAQDDAGAVWYMGEISRNFEDGQLVDLDGSWKHGVDGAKAGILMPATPTVGQIYRQEWFLGEAEDMGEILSLTGDESTSAASCGGACVVTLDTLPFEPEVLEHKYYAAGIGSIVEIHTETGERLELTEVVMP